MKAVILTCMILTVSMVLSVAALAQPTVTIYTDADTYQSGDTIEVSLSAQNSGEGMSVDVYIGLLTPDGGLYTLSPYGQSGWSGNLEAWIPDIYAPPDFSMSQTPLFWFDAPCSMPPIGDEGEYNFASLLTYPGTLEWVCDLSLAPFTVGDSAVSHYYVDGETGDDSNDGSEGAPWKTITHALASALSTPATIYIAAGTYAVSTNGETFPLNMKRWVSLSGDGAETTILDAEQSAHHVIYCDYASHLTIEGLTITGGVQFLTTDAEAKGSVRTDECGGGIYCYYSSPIITNNTISNNTNAYGAGIYCTHKSSPTIENNTISHNTGDWGAAIYSMQSCSPTIAGNTISHNIGHWSCAIDCHESSPTIRDNAISHNTGGRGGAVTCIEKSCPTITDNTISENTASKGGGIYCWRSSPRISSNTISNNTHTGIYCELHSWPTISSNTIAGNTASYGGAIYCTQSSPTILNNVIADNYADDGGGGICCYDSSSRIGSNTVEGNTASYGGAIYCIQSSPTISNNQITCNSAETSGGAIECWGEDTSPTIENNTIEANSADDGGGIHCDYRSWPTITNNTITGNSADNGGGICSGGYGSCPIIENNIISRNSAYLGGGICVQFYSYLSSYNNIVSCNSAHMGGGIYHAPKNQNDTIRHRSAVVGTVRFDIRNNTIVLNSADAGGGLYGGARMSIIDSIIWDNGDDVYGCLTMYCCIENSHSAALGDIHDDPMFVSGPFGDYYLHPDSPCIDSGSTLTGFSERTTQVDGTPDTGMVDMGYHYPIP